MKTTREFSWATAVQEWWDAESVSFTSLCGESMSHGEVCSVAAFCALFLPVLAIFINVGQWLIGGLL